MTSGPSHLLIGDLHGDLSDAVGAIEYAAERGITHVTQLGDWGFLWPGAGDAVKPLVSALEKHRVTMDFIDGNHDWHGRLWTVDGPWLNWMDRGSSWTAHGVTVAYLGGAASVDKHVRKVDKSWFATERISEEDALMVPPCDVLITHDCPLLPEEIAKHDGKSAGGTVWPLEAYARSEESRATLMSVVLRTRPRRLFHGHYHVGYGPRLLHHPDGFVTELWGLANNGAPKSLLVTDENFNPMHWGP